MGYLQFIMYILWRISPWKYLVNASNEIGGMMLRFAKRSFKHEPLALENPIFVVRMHARAGGIWTVIHRVDTLSQWGFIRLRIGCERLGNVDKNGRAMGRRVKNRHAVWNQTSSRDIPPAFQLAANTS
jgi:hypothetical protein